MLRYCEDTAYFVLSVPSGWPQRSTLHACVEDACDSVSVELLEPATATFARGPAGLVVAVQAANSCPAVLEEVCERTALGAISARRSTGKGLVVALSLRSAGGKPRRVSLRLERDAGDPLNLPKLPEQVTFDNATCRYPNGPRCEPKCCEAVYDLR